MNDISYIHRDPNTMDDVLSFLSRWDLKCGAKDSPAVRRSPWGNLNLTGGVHTSPASDLTPSDPEWDVGIEQGVRPLLVSLIRAIDCVTYDSCEGHFYPPTMAISPTIRRIGILPRTHAERGHYIERLLEVVRTANAALVHCPLQVQITRSRLYSIAASYTPHETIDVELVPRAFSSWEDYFAYLDVASATFLEILSQK